jgi:chromosome condensin MukBEF complex kleisin-like MukF subunit
VSGELEKGPKWEQAIEDPSAIRELQSTIENAFDKLEAQMRRMAKVSPVF